MKKEEKTPRRLLSLSLSPSPFVNHGHGGGAGVAGRASENARGVVRVKTMAPFIIHSLDSCVALAAAAAVSTTTTNRRGWLSREFSYDWLGISPETLVR